MYFVYENIFLFFRFLFLVFSYSIRNNIYPLSLVIKAYLQNFLALIAYKIKMDLLQSDSRIHP